MEEAAVDLVIAAGTSMKVFPAAEWVHTARAQGASLAVIDLIKDIEVEEDMNDGDWFFQGNVSVILPIIVNTITSQAA